MLNHFESLITTVSAANFINVGNCQFCEFVSEHQATLTSTTQIDVPSSCSFKNGYTATAQSDLDSLKDCDAIDGDLYVTGDIGSAAIANVRAVYGDLVVFNATQLTSFTADSINTITGEFRLTGLTTLDTLSMGGLTSVGAINWVTLPTLTDTGLTSVTECNAILISDTQLASLDGINPTNVETYNVNNNQFLLKIKSDIESVSNSLTVAYNGHGADVAFDQLQWANNITFYSVSSVSMANLTSVNHSIGFFETKVEDLHFKTLTKVGGDLTMSNNDDLTSIDFDNLESIGGGFVVNNNSKLQSVDTFDDLKTVTGAVLLTGDLSNVSLPALKSVRGAFSLNSDGSADCSPFDELHDSGNIQGEYLCKAASAPSSSGKSGSSKSTSAKGGDKTSATESGSESKSSKGDGAAVYSIEYTSVFGAVAAVLFALF
ncbi:unnamed protein product [Ambrosiozyma monospora]|uniref:Unnamed protein product n=1 Tax=Ambrosiozyma monospora TaxID=43982 RepID=A0ACB5SRK9_AMBMO|nr:unnamed protein product [Ambrosiozyma monospora]